MPQLKFAVDKIDDVPEPHRPLYSEVNGKWQFTGVDGLRTDADVLKMTQARDAERTEHGKTKTKVTELSEALGRVLKHGSDGTTERTVDEVLADLDAVPTLRAAAEGKGADKIAELVRQGVERDLRSKTGPLDRKIRELSEGTQTLAAENAALKQAIQNQKVGDALRRAAGEAKVLVQAVEDMVALGIGKFKTDPDTGEVSTEDGMTAKNWVEDQKKHRPYFWPTSQGAGGKGGAGGVGGVADRDNPWTFSGWNVTAQGKMLRAEPSRAESLAKAAGHESAVGSRRPAPPRH